MAEGRYVPANGRFLPTALYDRSIAITMREGAWRPRLVRDVLNGDPREVLDLGCGTGTLAIAMARAAGRARITGIDGDAEILDIARAKEGSEGIDFVGGLADALPFDDGSFDRVVCSLLLHHLDPAVKRAALAEARRVLRSGGRLHVADFGRSHDPLMRILFAGLQVLDGFANTADHPAGRLPAMIETAGFHSVERTLALRTAWGSFEVLSADR
ncbi:MAG: class I SAM-dependent methyltransferase [Thermoleophilaceae bacterium]